MTANSSAVVVGTYPDSSMCSDGTDVYIFYTEMYWSTYTSAYSVTQVGKCPSPGGQAYVISNLMARKLLPTPVVKTNTKTMKIIYEFTFV